MVAKEWMEGLLSKMDVEATLTVDVTGDEQATLSIDSPSARHWVGRQGSKPSVSCTLECRSGKGLRQLEYSNRCTGR